MTYYDVKKLNYRDKLARRNRLFFILKISGIIAALILVIGGGIYFLFFTDKLEIKEVAINGLKTLDRELIMDKINERLDYKKYGYLNTQKNIIFFDGDTLTADLLSANSVLDAVRIEKTFPHRLSVEISEKEPVGIWCAAGECRYFNHEMETWGQAVRSSGFLFLTVEDSRQTEKFGIDADFFRAINELTANLSQLTIKSIAIPENSFDEFRVYTDRNFYLVFSLDSNIKDQVDILKIFLTDKNKDPNFNPQYIDLRINGRVYYK